MAIASYKPDNQVRLQEFSIDHPLSAGNDYLNGVLMERLKRLSTPGTVKYMKNGDLASALLGSQTMNVMD